MKTLLICLWICLALAMLWLSHSIVPVLGPLVLAFLMWVGYAFFVAYVEREELALAGKRIEPVFVISLHPETYMPVALPPHLNAVCVHVPYRDVMKETARITDLLLRSGNGFMQEKDPNDNLPVVPIPFRDGRHVNEEWEDFGVRVLNVIDEVRPAWHERIKLNNPNWYNQHHHRQTTIQA